MLVDDNHHIIKNIIICYDIIWCNMIRFDIIYYNIIIENDTYDMI